MLEALVAWYTSSPTASELGIAGLTATAVLAALLVVTALPALPAFVPTMVVATASITRPVNTLCRARGFGFSLCIVLLCSFGLLSNILFPQENRLNIHVLRKAVENTIIPTTIAKYIAMLFLAQLLKRLDRLSNCFIICSCSLDLG